MSTNTRAIERALEQTGWELVTYHPSADWLGYRAQQGSYVTPWRENLEQVMGDVRRMMEPDPHEGRNEDDARIQER